MEGGGPSGDPAGSGVSVGDLVVAGALAAIAALVFVETASYPASLVPDAPGPAFFPRLVAGFTALLAGVLAWRALVGGTSGGGAAGRGQTAPGPSRAASTGVRPEALAGPRRLGAAGARRIGGVLALLAVFLLALPHAGTFVLLPPLLAAVMALMGERRPWALVGVPLLFDLFVYLVFFRFFSVDLPTVFF